MSTKITKMEEMEKGSVGKDVEQIELFEHAGKKVNCYHHFGKLFGSIY